MKITRENYEAFFLDYHEGNLGEEKKQELLLFLGENPDLKNEFEAFEIIEVSPPSQTFPGKEFLKKKGITTENYTNYFVAYVEGDLSSSDRKEVEVFAATSPSLKKELELFGKLKITPDAKIVFKNKNILRRQSRVIQLNAAIYRYAAAAVLALLVMTYFYMGNEKKAVLSRQETGQPASTPKHVEKQIMPGDHPVSTTLVATTDDGKKENLSGSRKLQPAHRNTSQTVRPAPTPVAGNSQAPAIGKQTEIPVLASGPSRNDDLNPAMASTTEKEKEPEKFMPALSDLREVFSNDELQELGLASKNEDQKKRSLWDFAAKSAAGLGKLTGTPIAMNKTDDIVEETKTVALEVGRFSVSHTSVR